MIKKKLVFSSVALTFTLMIASASHAMPCKTEDLSKNAPDTLSRPLELVRELEALDQRVAATLTKQTGIQVSSVVGWDSACTRSLETKGLINIRLILGASEDLLKQREMTSLAEYARSLEDLVNIRLKFGTDLQHMVFCHLVDSGIFSNQIGQSSTCNEAPASLLERR